MTLDAASKNLKILPKRYNSVDFLSAAKYPDPPNFYRRRKLAGK